MRDFPFDLQLFADAGTEGSAGAEEQTGGDAAKTEGAASPGTLNGAKDTILGA